MPYAAAMLSAMAKQERVEHEMAIRQVHPAKVGGRRNDSRKKVPLSADDLKHDAMAFRDQVIGT